VTGSRHPNLAASRGIARSLRRDAADDETLSALVVLAQSLAAQLDDAWAGGAPPYVAVKLAAIYAATLQLVSQLVKPPASDAFSDLVRFLNTPTLTVRASEEALPLRP
jgi:hypothetical protein